MKFIDYNKEKRIPGPEIDISSFSVFSSEDELKSSGEALLYQYVLSLKEEAAVHRINTLNAIVLAGSGHPGGSFSSAEIATCLYTIMKYDSRNPRWEQRDRFILSKGHGVPIFYSVLASHRFFPLEDLAMLRRLGGLPGHASHVTPGIDAPTGSLGQGLSVAHGVAEAMRHKGLDSKVYVVLGDGELQEGQVWEAARNIGNSDLGNIIAILDNNGVQQTGVTEEVSGVNPIREKFLAFGWEVIGKDASWGGKREDGHDFVHLINALAKAKESGKPAMIICNTIKGKGVSFMENKPQWHGRAPKGGEYEKALQELFAQWNAIAEEYESLK